MGIKSVHQGDEIKNSFRSFLINWNFIFFSSYKIVPLQAPTLLLYIPPFQNYLFDPNFLFHPDFKTYPHYF